MFECETFNIFFHMTAKILAEAQICISAPLKSTTDTRKMCKICLKLIRRTPEVRQLSRSSPLLYEEISLQIWRNL